MIGLTAETRAALRSLAIRDDAFVQDALASDAANLARSHLDPKTHAIVRLGALIAVGAADEPSYRQIVDDARRAGATTDEIVGALVAVMAATGVPRVIAAAPAVGLAIGYDVQAALESPDPPEGEPAPARSTRGRSSGAPPARRRGRR